MSVFNTAPSQPRTPSIPDFKAAMNILSKVNRIYEDNDWVIDLIGDNVRVSYFEDGHFVDEIILSKEDFKE
jgi:hypothetical protein